MFRIATMHDLDRIAAIYDAVLDAEDAGLTTTCWARNVYPVRATAEKALERGDLFVAETDDGMIAATAIINQIQVPEYVNCRWQYDAPDHQVMVLHTLAVDPAYHGQGIGTAFVRFYEQYAWDHHCPYLRMDTNARNTIARKLYKRLGYTEPGIVPCVFNGIPNVQLVCLEKILSF